MTEENQLSLAASEFIQLIESGLYKEIKQTESFLKEAKRHLRKELEERSGKRFEFRDENMVAKFVPKQAWEIDHVSLIDELFCYLMPEHILKIIRLDSKLLKDEKQVELLNAYQFPTQYYVRPTLNKVGKEKIGKFDFLFGGQGEKELITEIRDIAQWLKRLEDNYERVKSTIMRCPELNDKKKVSTPYGSVSLLPKRAQWNLNHVHRDFGDDFFIRYGKVITSKLEEMVQLGIVPKSLVDEHRKLIDIKLDFIVMRLDDEEKMFNMLQNKRQNLSLRRLA